MAAGLVTTISLNLNMLYQDADIISGQPPKLPLAKTLAATLQSGTGASQNRYLYANKTNASTTPTVIDLVTFVDVFGDTITPAVVRWIAIFNNSSTTGENIIFGGSSADASGWFSGTNPADIIPPGGMVFRYAPTGTVWALTQTTADAVAVTSATGTPEYELYIGMA